MTRLVRPGGHVVNIGAHGKPATLHLETLWIRDVTITTGLVDTNVRRVAFRDDVGIYQIHNNNGGWHDFGIVLGASLVFSGAAGQGSAPSRRRRRS